MKLYIFIRAQLLPMKNFYTFVNTIAPKTLLALTPEIGLTPRNVGQNIFLFDPIEIALQKIIFD